MNVKLAARFILSEISLWAYYECAISELFFEELPKVLKARAIFFWNAYGRTSPHGCPPALKWLQAD